MGNNNIYNNTGTTIVFPDEIRSQRGVRPIIKFTAYNRSDGLADQHHIVLPIPASMAFSDGADYNTIDLGSATNTINSMAQGEGIGAVSSVKASQILQIASKATPISEQVAFATKTIINPNTNTSFVTNKVRNFGFNFKLISFVTNKVRNFGFNFKLIATTPAESNLINEIHTTFRKFTYASQKEDSSNLTLDFPPVWTIRFMNVGDNEPENKFIPKIYSCYLTQCESTFNSEANLYFNDSAPLSVNISLQFQETRALTRKDFKKMEEDRSGSRGIRGGRATVNSLAANTLNRD